MCILLKRLEEELQSSICCVLCTVYHVFLQPCPDWLVYAYSTQILSRLICDSLWWKYLIVWLFAHEYSSLTWCAVSSGSSRSPPQYSSWGFCLDPCSQDRSQTGNENTIWQLICYFFCMHSVWKNCFKSHCTCLFVFYWPSLVSLEPTYSRSF